MVSCPVLIVPGLHGSGPGHWQHCWQQDVPDADLVAQDDWSDPHEDRWRDVLERAIINQPHSLIVAHSLGAILTAKLATSRVASLVAGALLVAPADINRTSVMHRRSYEFGAMPRQILPFPTLVVASRNDPYMDFSKVQALAQDWGGRLHDLGNAGHINVGSGYGRWSEGYDLAARVLPTGASN